MKTSSSSSGGAGFLSLLTIAFIVLKLTGVIEWSWWWVLAPLWGPVAAIFAVILLYFIFLVVKFVVISIRDRIEEEHFKRLIMKRIRQQGKNNVNRARANL